MTKVLSPCIDLWLLEVRAALPHGNRSMAKKLEFALKFIVHVQYATLLHRDKGQLSLIVL